MATLMSKFQIGYVISMLSVRGAEIWVNSQYPGESYVEVWSRTNGIPIGAAVQVIGSVLGLRDSVSLLEAIKHDA